MCVMLLLVTSHPWNAMANEGGDLRAGETEGEYYDWKVDDLRTYLNGQKDKNPSLYSSLDPELAKLESQNRLKWILFGAGMGTGLILIITGAASSGGEGVAVAGGALVTLSFIPLLTMGASRDDIKGVIDHHNKLNPKKPLKWNAGVILPNQGTDQATNFSLGGGLAVGMSF